MNILDLNDDIMSKIIHDLFLKSLVKHQKEFELFIGYDSCEEWEDDNCWNFFSINNGDWAYSIPREEYDEGCDFQMSIIESRYWNYN
eukprot:SAG11_NODE_5498_length_1543_cov_58.549861_1_plen_87_part_00